MTAFPSDCVCADGPTGTQCTLSLDCSSLTVRSTRGGTMPTVKLTGVVGYQAASPKTATSLRQELHRLRLAGDLEVPTRRINHHPYDDGPRELRLERDEEPTLVICGGGRRHTNPRSSCGWHALGEDPSAIAGRPDLT